MQSVTRLARTQGAPLTPTHAFLMGEKLAAEEVGSLLAGTHSRLLMVSHGFVGCMWVFCGVTLGLIDVGVRKPGLGWI